jgi:Rod binding domain-containing protein
MQTPQAASFRPLVAESEASVGKGTGPAAGAPGAAAEFESILLNQWLESARSTFGSAPGEEDQQDAADDQWGGFATQMLAKGITAAGGIGLSRVIEKGLRSAGTQAPATPVPNARSADVHVARQTSDATAEVRDR